MTDLHAAAAAAGLQRDWHDAEGRAHRVADDTLRAILATLDQTPPAEPFVSAVRGTPTCVSLPPGPAMLELEDGGETRVILGADGILPPIDTIGYHRLHAAGVTIHLAIAPPRCPSLSGRGWAPAVQIPALRHVTPTAFGDLGALADAVIAFAQAGAAALAISPTHALFPADPTRFSPYSPSSRLFHNVLLADPALIGAPPPPDAAPELIDWPTAAPARLRHLRAAWTAAGDDIRTAVAAHRTPDLDAHARFDALHAHLGGHGWPDWPTAFHDPAGPAVARFAAEHANDVTFHAFLQWLADHSLATAQAAARTDMRIGLIADLAVGLDHGGSDAWRRRDELLAGVTIGAPPDPLGPAGQNWGITTLDPFALRRHAFRPFARTLRTALRHAGGLRIDHALGLQRLWVIPAGGRANEGAYLTMPCADLLRITAIEAHRAAAIVIGEDLGTVPAGFRDTLAAHGLLGMQVLPFEREPTGSFHPADRWSAQSVAMTGTHDTPTLAGWWHGRDLDWNARLGRGADAADRGHRTTERERLWHAVGGTGSTPADPPLDATLALVAATPAPLAILAVEDLIGEEEQPNLPGTIDEHPNWRRRLLDTVPALLARPDVAARTAMLTRERPA